MLRGEHLKKPSGLSNASWKYRRSPLKYRGVGSGRAGTSWETSWTIQDNNWERLFETGSCDQYYIISLQITNKLTLKIIKRTKDNFEDASIVFSPNSHTIILEHQH